MAINNALNIRLTEWRWVAVVSLLILAVTIAPNIYGYLNTPNDLYYTGLAYNWQDANSYLAKLRQGVRGDWLYRVPFTAEPGDGTFLYPNYLLLGHLAAWLGIEPVLIFHGARLTSGAVLLASLYAFVSRFFADVRDRRLAFLLAAICSGFGWMPLLFGTLLPDILNAEIFPFLAILANPHFPLAMAALLWLMDTLIRPIPAQTDSLPQAYWLQLIAGTLILAITQPYGLVSAGIVASAWMAIRWVAERRIPSETIRPLFIMMLVAAPFAVYDAWALTNNAALAGWNQQNITLSPPVWQWVISGGFVLVLALIGFIALARRPYTAPLRSSNDWLLLLWVAAIALLVALPGAQQRRFSFGLFIPLSVLSVHGLYALGTLNAPLTRLALVAFSSITNIIIILLAFAAVSQHPTYLFFTRGEWNALIYLRSADPHALVLVSPEMGLYIPAWSGQRVIYGHPHETANAKARATEVQRFYAGSLPDADQFLASVDYILVGPREMSLGAARVPASFRPAFVDGDVVIYARQSDN